MAKKICVIIICTVTVLFSVSMKYVVDLGLDAKLNEYYGAYVDVTRYGLDYYTKGYKAGELTFQDAANGLCVHEASSVDFPMATYSVVYDKKGNVVAESGTMLEINLYSGETREKETFFVNIEQYLTDDIRQQILDICEKKGISPLYGIFDDIELYRDGDSITPVTLIAYYDDETYKVKLSDAKANITLKAENGNAEGEFVLLPNNLDGKMEKHYKYLKSVAADYCQQIKDGNKLEDMSSSGGGNPDSYSVENVSVDVVSLGSEEYYLLSSQAANTMLSVFSDEDYIKAFITMAAVYLLVGAVGCVLAVKISKEYE